MNIFIFISFLSSFALLILGNYVYYLDEKNQLNRFFGAFCFFISFWIFGQFMYRQAGSSSTALFWIRISLNSYIFAALLFLQFAAVFTKRLSILRHKRLFVLAYIIATGIYIGGATTDLYAAGAVKEPWGYAYVTANSWLSWLSLVWGMAFVFYSAFLFLRYYRESEGTEKQQAGYVAIAIVAVVVFGLIEIALKVINPKIPELTSASLVLFAAIVSYAISKHKLFSLSPAKVSDNIISTMTDSLVLIDSFGTIISVNPAIVDLLGYEKDDLIGREAGKIFADKGSWDELLSRIITESKPIKNQETVYRGKSGVLVNVLFSSSVIRGDDGRIAGIVAIAKDITERKQAEEAIKHMAYYDSLTGLPNRLLLKDRLNQALVRAKRTGGSLAFLYLDLDGFKQVNDEFGHDIGDLLLQAVGKRLSGSLREADTAARIGGDEFNIILPDIQQPRAAFVAAEKILRELSKAFVVDNHELFVTAGIGISTYPQTADTAEALIINADLAMRQAKKEGLNEYRYFSEDLQATSIKRLSLENDLRQALDRHEMVVHYQPIIDVAQNGRIMGAEALLRWEHPEKGLLYPKDFIDIAEETGLIIPIGQWVLRTACAQNKVWHEAGFMLMVPVNFSARQFRQADLARTVFEILDQMELEPNQLELELTENAILEESGPAPILLKRLVSVGVHVAVDDFGTGYSPLTDLERYPIDTIKISRSFIRDIDANIDTQVIVKSIVALAKSQNLKIIAEGVETEEQMNFLIDLGVSLMQGFYFSKPIPAADFGQLLRQKQFPRAA